jgi:hypothetical protein
MSTNCIILTGLHGSNDFSKTAGPYRIATELRDAGYSTQVIDISFLEKFDKLFKIILKKFISKETLWIGFSVNFLHHLVGIPWFNTAEERVTYRKKFPNYDAEMIKFMAFCRSYNPNIKFIVGGIVIYDLTELGFIHFRGNTDLEIVKFTNSLKNNVDIKTPVIFNKEYKNFVNSQIKYTKADVFSNEKVLPIEISRGCMFRCKFCNFPLNGKTKGEYIKDYGLLREEFNYNYANFGITHYLFSDDTFNESMVKLNDLYNNVFSKLDFKITFTTYIRLDLVHSFKEMAHVLQESGLVSAVCGVETIDPDIAKSIGKGLHPQKQIDLMRELKQGLWKNIVTSSGWIIGFPNETKKSITDFSKWVISEDNPFNYNIVSPLNLRPPQLETLFLYRSEFDISYDTKGYEFFKDDMDRLLWRLPKQDLDVLWCRDVSAEINKHKLSRSNSRWGLFNYPRLHNLGISEIDLQTKTPLQISKEYDIDSLIKNYKINYIKGLMSL